jgi:C-terminal processing protease CtpA/Prc
METLRLANAEQIELLAQAIQNSPENEVARRCVDLLERCYATGDRDSKVVRQSSDALEAAAKSDRWFVAEAARDSLERHWKRRVEIAMLDLQKLGAGMSPKAPEKLWENNQEYSGPFNRLDPTSDDHLKIFIDEYWKADAGSFDLLQRLTPLVSHDFMRGTTRVSVVLIDGHTQEPEEIAQLNAIFGDTRVSKRGRVCLGISHSLQADTRTGVEVSNVQQGSSASTAKIQPNDLLMKFEGKTLKDFDELIELLKSYRPDDEVTFEVLRYGVREPFDVKVKLQGWYER